MGATEEQARETAQKSGYGDKLAVVKTSFKANTKVQTHRFLSVMADQAPKMVRSTSDCTSKSLKESCHCDHLVVSTVTCDVTSHFSDTLQAEEPTLKGDPL